jgi:2-oxoglutarate dehydrogenase E2 component (dihydrolipoamide succinyltransferase)
MAIVEVKVPQLSESVAKKRRCCNGRRRSVTRVARGRDLDRDRDRQGRARSAGARRRRAHQHRQQRWRHLSRRRGDREDRHRRHAGRARCERRSACPAAPQRAPAARQHCAWPMSGASARQRRAMPAAAKLMADNRIPAATIAGTGKDGRVTKGDVLASMALKPVQACRRRPSHPPRQCPPPRPALPGRHTANAIAWRAPEQRVPMSRLRARIAERLCSRNRPERDPHHLQRSQHGPGDGRCARSTRRSSRRNTASSSAS